MTITVNEASYDLPTLLMPCRCKRGDLRWNPRRRAWCCDSTHLWIDSFHRERHCEAGLAFSALFDQSDGVTARPTPITDLPMTDYGLILVIRGTLTLPHITADEARRLKGYPQRLLSKIEGFERGCTHEEQEPQYRRPGYEYESYQQAPCPDLCGPVAEEGGQ